MRESRVVLNLNTHGLLKCATQRRNADFRNIPFDNDCNMFFSPKQPVLRYGNRVTLRNLILISRSYHGNTFTL